MEVHARCFLRHVDGGDGGAAGGQHGIQHDQFALAHIRGQFAIVLDGQVGLRVAVQADMAYLRGGNRASVTPSTMPRPARRMGTMPSFLPSSTWVLHVADGGFDLDLLQRQVERVTS